jgi:hypothetical protein
MAVDQSSNVIKTEKQYIVPFLTDDIIRWGLIIGVILLFVIGYLFRIRYNSKDLVNLAKLNTSQSLTTITPSMPSSIVPSTIESNNLVKMVSRLNATDQF